jgi:hypothetical protein
MTLDYDPVPVLESVGYTEREAAFLYLVALHSGYFLRRQYDRFIRRGRGAIAAQFLRKAVALGHLQIITCGQVRFVYHLAAKQAMHRLSLASWFWTSSSTISAIPCSTLRKRRSIFSPTR